MSASARKRKTAEILLAQSGAERRRHRRVFVPGVAAVRSGRKLLGLFAVGDLSVGGISLVGEALLLPQQPIEILVQLAGRPALSLTGRVLRRQVSGARGRRCAVRFEGLSPAAADGLAGALTEPAATPGAASLLVVWNRPAGRANAERELQAIGAEPLLVTGPLEAAAWLRVPGHKLEAVLIDYLLAGTEGWDFLQYLREQHPQQRRVLLVDGVGNFRLNLLLSSGLADAALEKPWTAIALARKLRTRRDSS